MNTAVLFATLVVVAIVAQASPSIHEEQQFMSKTVTENMMQLRVPRDTKPTTFPKGQNHFTLQMPDRVREYYVWVPKNYTGEEAVPLHFSYHGLGDTCLNFGQATGFSQFADERTFLYVYPCSTSGILGSCWNSGVCCCEGNGADDFGFTTKMIEDISKNFKVDPKRIYASGFSNGAFMAEVLGCVMPDVFAATASVSGVVELVPGNSGGLAACDKDYANRTKAVSVVNIHGTADLVVPFTGDALLGFPPIPDDFSAWAKRNGCTGEPKQTINKGTFTDQIYETCDDGSVVQLIKNAGGGHEWPSSDGFDTSTYIVDFFKL